ncbi:MAG: trypsin-like peptidase domain-containing protein [Candidatus Kerfeldbacteria bacterium]|nr:trypsin-like peptidase domain-containing protein [Candidatus Kerfeldbacteria bacterium]
MNDTPLHETSVSSPVHKRQQHGGIPVLAVSVILSILVGGLVGGVAGYWAGNATPSPAGQNGTVRGSLSVEEESTTTDVVQKAAPSVVSVVLTQELPRFRDRTPFEEFFGLTPQPQNGGEQKVGAGSGFIISSDGLILTNKHVVDATNVDITVIFNDGSEHKGQVLGVDPFNDLAVIKIEGSNLPVVELGDSDMLKLGETVIAIGNALGEFRNTVTKGVVSGINRTITAGNNQGQAETIEEAIQTDAAINPGNSGGPLINLAGQVVGINTAVSSEGQLVGFAIPINIARQVTDSITKFGKIVRPYLGVRYTMINEEVKQANSLKIDEGALVVGGDRPTDLAVMPGSPADKAGIVEGDILLEFNGGKITQEKTLATYMRKAKVDDEVKLKILHDGDEKTITVKLEAFDEAAS